jgi:hypothetical protein
VVLATEDTGAQRRRKVRAGKSEDLLSFAVTFLLSLFSVFLCALCGFFSLLAFYRVVDFFHIKCLSSSRYSPLESGDLGLLRLPGEIARVDNILDFSEQGR